jgi:hypothetical protein
MEFLGGEYHNFYKVELINDLPGLSLKMGEIIEVKGKDIEHFEYKKHAVKKSDCKILKKMIRAVKK